MRNDRTGIRCCLLLFLFLSNTLAAQTVLEGTVKDRASGRLLCDVICTVTDLSGKRLLGFGMSGQNGIYRLEVEAALDSVFLKVSLLGYKDILLCLPNRSKRTDVEMEVEAIELNEVFVKSKPIWSMGDTLNYDVGALKSGQDEVIGDVLKKLPGIEVSKAGNISYQGEPINRFYIEGMDLLGNKYSIATNNVPVDAVERVQVYENHQPIRALSDVTRSDQAAINLKLKGNRMSRPIVNAELGAGGDAEAVLFTAKLFGMQVGQNRQAMATFKANNTGHELWSELSDHALMTSDYIHVGRPSYPSDLVSPFSLNKPATEEARYLDNTSYIGSFNHLWRVSESGLIRVTGTYLNERNRQRFAEWDSYWLRDSILRMETLSRVSSLQNQGEAVVVYTNNLPTLYVDNKLKFFGRWQSTDAEVGGTVPEVEHFSTPLWLVENDLDVVKRTEKRTYRVVSFLRYASQPQRLKVVSDSIVWAENGLLQRSERGVFSTRNYTSFSHSVGCSKFEAGVRFNADLEYLTSEADSRPLRDELLFENDLKWNRYEYAVEPGYTFNVERSNLQIAVPLSLIDLYANDRVGGAGRNHVLRFLANPSVSYRYKFNVFWNMNASCRWNKDIGDMLDYANGLRMLDFRTFTVGSGILEERSSQSYSLRFAYRNQATALFFNVVATYRMQKTNLVTARQFVGNYSVTSREKQDDERDYAMVNVYAGKYFGAVKTNVRVSGGYTNIQLKQFQQGQVYALANHLLNVSCKLDIEPAVWTSLFWHTEFLGNKVVSASMSMDWMTQLRSRLGWYVFLSEKWQLNVTGEYAFNENSDSRNLNLFFLDCGIKYRMKRWDISVDATNVLDKRSYTYSSYDGVNRYSSYYGLRPAACLVRVGFKI